MLDDPAAEPEYLGARDVNTVVMIGAPNEGTLDTLESHNQGVHVVRRLPLKASFTMPAAYQTLPSSRARPVIDASGRVMDIDLYGPELWERYGWTAFGRASLKRLHERTISSSFFSIAAGPRCAT